MVTLCMCVWGGGWWEGEDTLSNNFANLECLNVLKVVSVPTLKSLVFAGGEEHVSVGKEPNSHDAVVMGNDRLMAVTKIQSPYSNILVCRGTDKKGTVLQSGMARLEVHGGYVDRLTEDMSIESTGSLWPYRERKNWNGNMQ